MRLKRCPFCGGKPKHIEYTKGVSHTIWCPGCGVETNDPPSKAEACDLWNQRSREQGAERPKMEITINKEKYEVLRVWRI